MNVTEKLDQMKVLAEEVKSEIEAFGEEKYQQGYESGLVSSQSQIDELQGVINAFEETLAQEKAAAKEEGKSELKVELKQKLAEQQESENQSEQGFASLLD